MKFQETYEKMKKDIKKEKEKLENVFRSNDEVQNVVQQKNGIKQQITGLEDKYRRNNLGFMSIKEKIGEVIEAREEN